MILGSDDRRVELGVSQLDGHDVAFGARATIGQFAGAAIGVVVGEQWQAFLRDLRTLERDRHGSVELATVEPMLRIRIYSTDRAGHMAIEGELRDLSLDDAPLVLQFTHVAFDPGSLPSLIRELSGPRSNEEL